MINWILGKVAGPYLVYGLLALFALNIAQIGVTKFRISMKDAKIAKLTEAHAKVVGEKAVAEADTARYKVLFNDAKTRYELLVAESLRVERANAEALAAAQEAAERATARADAFSKRFSTKPKNCADALAALDAACPTLKDY